MSETAQTWVTNRPDEEYVLANRRIFSRATGEGYVSYADILRVPVKSNVLHKVHKQRIGECHSGAACECIYTTETEDAEAQINDAHQR